MTKFKKIVSGTLAGCLMASALMMSAGAANVQTYIPSGTVQAAAQNTAQTRTAVKSIRRARTSMLRAFRPPSRARRQDGLHGVELQRLDLHAAAHGWPLDGQKYLVGQCIAHGIPVRHYGKVVSVCG
ncbi:hypothetical protein [Butyricicoccus sp. OF10-2]|uniref:hypothetical protein n=1 Tax=Butyricicoccus sp. OF10-2 TaxID=2292298 RepID=UPI001FAA43C9|nr:hypothetical protein [Butyricicoccus sp. OF10-2]